MSRIGKKPITIPGGVTVTQNGAEILAKGPKGERKENLPTGVELEIKDNALWLKPTAEAGEETARWGLARALMNNLIKGVNEGFVKNLIMQGVGYRAAVKGEELELNLGYSHPITVKTPAGISFQVEKNKLTISGINKELVGETAAKIRQLRLPEPYKGSGVRYEDEIIVRKAGKKAATAAG
ncbi:MAG: 50S ribosomal protein L6 [Parcubacteria group bacterium GW2011_GWA1_49_11]|nr:MAG: 50S ribosomal protein L6 [Parcubacteria group bacterium GW2011_GWA1_49_11]